MDLFLLLYTNRDIIVWIGKGIGEVGVDENEKILVRVNEKYFRPTEVETLLGDSTKAKNILNWEPKNSFEELVKDMVQNDLQ